MVHLFQIFSKAKIMFSIGGHYYNGKTIGFSYVPDRSLENARNVTIQLHNRVGRFVKMRLFFASAWIMLSEVIFESGKWLMEYRKPRKTPFPHLAINCSRKISGARSVNASLEVETQYKPREVVNQLRLHNKHF